MRQFSDTTEMRQEVPIRELLRPKTVAVIGASEDLGKFGGRILRMLLRHNFPGTIYPINPNRATLLGIKAYESVADTPTAPDLAIMAVPQAQVKAHIEECAARGVRCAIVVTAKFSDAGPEGAALEREIVEIARNANMRIIGPNCLGVISPEHRLVLCSSPSLDIDSLPSSPIGFVSQSGALMATLFDRAVAMGIGFTHCVSVGNQADLELCDFVEFLIDDPSTRVICSYLEQLKSPRRFVELARRARKAGKPWLMVKAGISEAGSRVTFSHTASLAGEFAPLAAVCRAENIVLLDDVFAMLLLAAAMARHPGRRVDKVVVMSISGGSAALATDRLAEIGAPLTRFSPETQARLNELYVPGQANNPVDLYAAKVKDVADFGYQSAQPAFADPGADLGLIVVTSAPNLAGLSAEMARGATESGKPVLFVMQPGHLADAARDELARTRYPFTDALTEAVEAIRAWRAWSAFEEPDAAEPIAGFSFDPPRGAVELGEAAAKALLKSAGIAVNEGFVVKDAAEARARAAQVGFPLVAKVISPQVVHKTEVGGVAPGLRSAGEVEEALAAIRSRVAAARPDARIEGFLLQRMVAGDVELLVGARRDPLFGPMVTLASGGVLVELLKDAVIFPAPVSRKSAREALRSLRIAPLLDGYRGRPAVDVEAAVDAIVRFGAIAARMGERDFEIEVNPMKLGPDGCIAVDARARFGA